MVVRWSQHAHVQNLPSRSSSTITTIPCKHSMHTKVIYCKVYIYAYVILRQILQSIQQFCRVNLSSTSILHIKSSSSPLFCTFKLQQKWHDVLILSGFMDGYSVLSYARRVRQMQWHLLRQRVVWFSSFVW